MEENKKDEGLKENENDTQGNESSPENEFAGDGIINKEDVQAKAQALLDGTSKDKKIVVKKDRFDDRNEKAKLYEAHAPLLDKVLKDPELVEKLLETDGQGNVEGRLERLEAERKAEKRSEMRRVVTESITRWPNFEESWGEVQPMMDVLVKKGYSYQDAMSRAYIAIHPEVAQAETERIAREGFNREGSFSFGGSPIRINKIQPENKLSEDEKKVFRALSGHAHMPKEEADYARLMDKHKDWLESKFSDADRL